ncbi:hypothetical protein [Undibacter mobilis]|uniref:Uncharacterized protein n=1 Tax=Undibacter mobilis TaxID=2292256 RepID=A0A371BB68_9BRAD|nr:hypothetical protein [Undibacter mobilis]RDV04865.1 hypothetical protein DXH78_09995 [Undibacter mobilis]
MDRVKDYIRFVVWFVGLSYVALWPAAGSDLAPLSPGLHLIGMLAAFWVLARLCLLLCGRVAGKLLPKAAWASLSPRRLRAALGRVLMRLTLRRIEPPPPHYVHPRREFGLRGEPR